MIRANCFFVTAHVGSLQPPRTLGSSAKDMSFARPSEYESPFGIGAKSHDEGFSSILSSKATFSGRSILLKRDTRNHEKPEPRSPVSI